jgi:hypothetical protein
MNRLLAATGKFFTGSDDAPRMKSAALGGLLLAAYLLAVVLLGLGSCWCVRYLAERLAPLMS